MDERKRILEYQKRREKRLKDRGLVLVKNRFDFFRSDADGDDENNNQNNKGGGESHGNTRLPFGLCKRYGIEIGKDWTPKDAWDALKGKGVTPEGAYERLEKGEDPGTPEAPATPETKPAKKTITRTIDGETKEWEVGDTEKEEVIPFSGEKPYVIKLKHEGDDQEMRFGSKEAMMKYLKEEGITEVADPDTGEVVDPTKMEFPEKVKTWKGTEYPYEAEYSNFEIKYFPWDKHSKWRLHAERVPGSWSTGGFVRSVLSRDYKTKEDLLYALKEMGIEEIDDPETGETIDPKEMELTPKVFTLGSTGYKALAIGLRDGRYYTLTGIGLDGRREKLSEFLDLESAKEWLRARGADPEIAKLSPSLKKREEERVSWLTSDKTEYYTDPESGVRYGDLRAEKYWRGWKLYGEGEGGVKRIWEFDTKMQMMKALKEQGVEKVKIDKEAINPKEYEVPKTVATIRGKDFQEMHIGHIGSDFYLQGTDVDGEYDSAIMWTHAGETIQQFFRRVKQYTGLEESDITMDDSVKEAVEERKKADEEKERKRREFEEKAITVGSSMIADPHVEVDSYGHVRLFGTDKYGNGSVALAGRSWAQILHRAENLGVDIEPYIKNEEVRKGYEDYKKKKAEFEKKAVDIDGEKYADLSLVKDFDGTYRIEGVNEAIEKTGISLWGDLYDTDDFAKEHGIDMESIIQDDDLREEYRKYKKAREEFEEKAVDIGGRKYSGVEVTHDGGQYIIEGRDKRGNRQIISVAADWEGVQDNLKGFGYSKDSFPLSEEAKKRSERAEKAKSLVEGGGWYHMGDRDQAYTDMSVVKWNDSGDWGIVGKDMDGKEQKIGLTKSSWDAAIGEMERQGVKDYKVMENGKDIGKPRWGMHSVMLMRKPDGGYIIYADSKKYGKHAVMYEDPKEENARKWLTENGIPQSSIKTRGMNPNDDKPRTHTAKSLEGFDEHRMKRAEESKFLSDMSDGEKTEVANMLTDIFKTGAYRMRRKGHFEDIFDERFKTLLETGTSGGSSYKPGRRDTGVESFGHAHDIKGKDAEKYGYLGVDDDEEALGYEMASWYGDTVYKFKKDKIKDRVTYSLGDTLDADRPIVGYAGDYPTIEGTSALDCWGGGKQKLQEVLKLYKKYKNGETSFGKALNDMVQNMRDRYIETHYHGDLTLADVDSITFPMTSRGEHIGLRDTFAKMKPEKRQKVVDFCKANGIKLQYYERGEKKVRDAYDYLEREYGVK